jgi:molecular chaperone IbpA
MATLDFTPLFDRVPMVLSHAMQWEESRYPPYNIEKCGEDQYRIVTAVAGFGKDVAEHNRLTVRGQIKERNGRTYLHRGIATRSFQRQFDLTDFVEVTGATMGDGLLVIDMKRELPEELKPRKIEINAGKISQIEHKAFPKSAA